MDVFPHTLLLAVDGSPDAALAARAAVQIAGASGAELHVVHVWQVAASAFPTLGLDAPARAYEAYNLYEIYEAEGRALLAEQAERIAGTGVTVAGTHLRMGRPAEEIVALGEELDAGLVLTGSRGRGTLRRLVLGSVSQGVVHQASRPVLVLRGGDRAWPPARVVIGDDASPPARAAGELAARIGKLVGARGVVVRASPPLPRRAPGGRATDTSLADDVLRQTTRTLEERADELAGPLGRRPEVRAALGDPAAAILAAAEEGEEPALIAVGSRGLGAIERLRMGSNSAKVLAAAGGAVLIAPPAKGRAP